MSRIIFSLIPVIAVSLFSSCLKDKGIGNSLPCDPTSVYIADIRPIIETKCMDNNTGCHIAGGSGNGDFSKYSVLKDKVDQGVFKIRVFDKKEMPKSPYTLTSSQLNTLKSWVDAGALDCNNK